MKAMKKVMTLMAALLACLGLAAQNTMEEDLDPQYAVDLLRPGTQAPDFALQDINGKTFKLSDFQGRKVVLVFWASWCPDCRAEVPELKAMHAAANPEKAAFVSVSFDRTLEALQNYVNENYLPGVQLFDPAGKKESKVAADYGVKWIPSLYLIDETGKVQLGTVMIGKIADALGTAKKPSLKKNELCSDESCAL
jgi:peroxiredoxin